MKKQKLLPFLAAAFCSFAIAGTAFSIAPSLRQPTGVGAADSGSLLNSCDSVGTFWCANGTSVNSDASYIEEGSGSVCVATSGWAPINVDLGKANVTDFAYIKMTIWSSNPVKLLAGDINFNSDPECILAELAAGKNEVTIPVQKLVAYGLTARTIAPYVSGATTLYFDNIVGYMAEPASTTLLNACDTSDGFWCNSTATVNTDATYIVQGSGSVKMTFSGWQPMNIYWGTSTITNYDYVKMTIFSTQAVKFLAGNINFIDDPDCILAELVAGKNEVTIPVSKLVKYGLTDAICAPYVSGDTTLYFDNIMGIVESTEEGGAVDVSSTLNNCDVASGDWVETNGSYTIESTLMTEGGASIRLNLSANNYFTLSLRNANDNSVISKDQLLSFDYLSLDVNNVTSGNVGLFLYNAQVATLVPGWNTVLIPKATIEEQIGQSATQFENGKFLFCVYADCTLLVDNVRGLSEDDLYDSYTDFSGIHYSAMTSGQESFVKFGASSVTTLTSAQAAAAGVPTGYTDNVIYATGGSQGIGVALDFSSLAIPYTTVEYITFRVYFPSEGAGSGYPDVRIYRPDGTNDYVVNYDVSTYADGWYNFVLKPGETFSGNHNFSHLSKDGYLDKFEFAIRSNNTSTLYIDSITMKLTTDIVIEDYDNPVITYHGADTVYVLANDKPFTLDVTAYDKTQGNLSITCEWDNPYAVNPDGTLNPGTYMLTMKATDLAGNYDAKTVKVVAVAKDTNAPVITVVSDAISLFAGTKPQLIPTITDDSGIPTTVTTVWSSGALNNAGRLNAGTHTCTITATDLSGNSSSKTITVTVIGEDDNIIDESTPITYTFTANGGTGDNVGAQLFKGESLVLPDCMFTAPANSSFAGWAVGSANAALQQPGTTITLTENLTIYAVWSTHAHSFDSDWKSDENGHWKECDCGQASTPVAHADNNNDHACDDCAYTMSECADNDNNHKCDVCDTKLTDCEDKDNNHKCDACDTKLTDCEDKDNNHKCDACDTKLTDCEDKDNNHKCDTCDTKLTDCKDNDNNHKCDVCDTKLTDCEDKDNNHKCDTCDTVVSQCADNDNDNACDICGTVLTCFDNNNDHMCDDCGTKLTDCKDNDNNHKCDVCDTTLSDCKDTDSNHKCDVCDTTLSDCKDTDSNHKCDTCQDVLSQCQDNDNDHKCDTCQDVLSQCQDNDNDHKCDTCQDVLSQCQDNDHDHKCDTCQDVLSQCDDKNNDHNCDTCGNKVSDCNDGDKDHDCDTCGNKVSDCADADNDHFCDICQETLSGCADKNNDHNCDTCGDKLSDCVDENNNHDCDVCDKVLSNCADENNDHKCDACGALTSHCTDANNDHNCDVCAQPNSKCLDKNSDGNCDICGKAMTPTNTAPSKKGCRGSIGGLSVGVGAMAIALLSLRKKKED